MYWTLSLLVVCLVTGCVHDDVLPPVPPAAEDLSTWSVPELVQPPVPEPDTPPPVPVEDKPRPGEKVYPFTPGTTFLATVPVGWPLTIVFERGEQVRTIVGGDRTPHEPNQPPRFEVKEGAEGLGDTLRPQVFLTATAPGLTMGVVIATTKRTYFLECKSVASSPVRMIRWQYKPDPPQRPVKAKEPGLLPDPTQPKLYHVGYDVAGSRATISFVPRHVVDDGKKTFIVYPEVSLFERVPVIRLLGPNGAMLTNARQFLNVLIVDELITRAELRFGVGEQADIVTITRGNLRTIQCPNDPDCPVWPQAAQALARRHP